MKEKLLTTHRYRQIPPSSFRRWKAKEGGLDSDLLSQSLLDRQIPLDKATGVRSPVDTELVLYRGGIEHIHHIDLTENILMVR